VYLLPSHAIPELKGRWAVCSSSSFALPELVLLELQVPGVSGLEVLKWAREQPEFRLLPVVILTSSVQASGMFFSEFRNNGLEQASAS